MYLKMTIHSEYWDGVYIWDLPFWNEPISKNPVTRVTSVFCGDVFLGSDELFISGESLGVKLPFNCSTPISYLKKLFDDKTLWTSLQLKILICPYIFVLLYAYHIIWSKYLHLVYLIRYYQCTEKNQNRLVL